MDEHRRDVPLADIPARPAARVRRRRGSPVLPASGRRSHRARPRRLPQRPVPGHGRGRQHPDAAARADALSLEPEIVRPEGPRGGPRGDDRFAAVEAADPRAVSESHLSQRRRVRRRDDVAAPVPQAREEPESRRVRARRRARPCAVRALAVDQPRGRPRPQPHRAGADAPGRVHHRGAGARGEGHADPHCSVPRRDRSARRLRERVPAPAVPRSVRRRPSARLGRADDVRAAAAGSGRTRRRRGIAAVQRPAASGGARRDRPAQRRHPRARRRPGFPAVPVQPRRAQPPAAGVRVQAAAVCRRARPRVLAGHGPGRAREHPSAGPRRVGAAQRPRRHARRADAARRAHRVEQPRRDRVAAAPRIASGPEARLPTPGSTTSPTCRRCRSAPAK